MRYLIVPIPKAPYNRIGPEHLQDWYRSVVKTIKMASELSLDGHTVSVALISNFKPKDGLWEVEIYEDAFKMDAPWLNVRSYKETNDTLGQVERAFELGKEMNAKVIFVSAWLQYLRVLYLARGHNAIHFGAFGIPHPLFAIADPVFTVLFPILDCLGLQKWFQNLVVRRRESGKM